MDEKKIVSIVKPYLDRCRSGDWNHALRVVKWVKELGKGREDLDILVAAAYVHDIGWTDILPSGKLDLKEMLRYEDKANENTSKRIHEVFDGEFSQEEIGKIIRLVDAADRHASEKDDEAIIVDADSLSKLCVEHVKEKYAEDSYAEVLGLWENSFADRCKTEKARSLYPGLLRELKEGIGYGKFK